MGAYQGSDFIYIGKVSSGLTQKELRTLDTILKRQTTPESPFRNLRKTPNTYWVKPTLTLLVEFLEWTPNLKMRAPVVKGFTNKKPEECRLD
ncbi:DNA polymerase LigD, ligase domain protein [Calderihabitans maritimus]|uniref:DNA ligase (ATP) n=1 Tax=Calderihabitans maritimus TaxID=1246530 RepID=A0A1Z5HS23_9FIRM|nr:DNA polymerase LigD, ligase domain protein [Calderihabitans maritimus]